MVWYNDFTTVFGIIHYYSPIIRKIVLDGGIDLGGDFLQQQKIYGHCHYDDAIVVYNMFD